MTDDGEDWLVSVRTESVGREIHLAEKIPKSTVLGTNNQHVAAARLCGQRFWPMKNQNDHKQGRSFYIYLLNTNKLTI